jgi:hypothetical protein
MLLKTIFPTLSQRTLMGLAALVLVGGLFTTAVSAEESVESRIVDVAGLTVAEVQNMIYQLKTAVTRKDRQAACRLITYPVEVGRLKVRTVAQCKTHYNKIFTAKVTKVIQEQQFQDLFVSWRGVMMGNGEVWMQGVCPDSNCSQHKLELSINP